MIRFERLAKVPWAEKVHKFPADSRTEPRSIVRFQPTSAPAWIGTFQGGVTEYDQLLEHPDGRNAIVICGGAGYVIDPETGTLLHRMSESIAYAEGLPELNAAVLGDGIYLETIRADGIWWRSSRISWDGMRNIAISHSKLSGEAFSPIDDTWHPFTVDLLSGVVCGASYNGPPMPWDESP